MMDFTPMARNPNMHFDENLMSPELMKTTANMHVKFRDFEETPSIIEDENDVLKNFLKERI